MSNTQNQSEEPRSQQGTDPQISALRKALERLQRALADEVQNDADCNLCRAALPDIAAAELDGQRVAKLFPFETGHLDGCLSCAEEYGELVDTLLALETMTVSPSAPAPSLPTHTQTALRIRAWVTQAAQQILDRALGAAGDVDLMLTTLLERLPDLSVLSTPQLVTQVALGYGTEDDETPVVLATWITTQRLAEKYAATELGALASRNELVARARQEAEATASQMKFSRSARRDFVEAYGRSVAADPDAYVSLGRHA